MRAHRPIARDARRSRGFAMLIVLLISSIVIVMVAELAYQAGLELLAANNVSDIGTIEYAIDGQFEVVLGTLRHDKRQNEIDAEYDAWNEGDIRSRRDGDVALATRVFDEQGKFNVMRLVGGQNDAQRLRAREIFVRILDLFRDGISEDKAKGGDLDLADAEDIADRVLRHLKREGATGQVPKPKTLPAGVPLLLDELLFTDQRDDRLIGSLLRDVQTKDRVAPGLHRYITCYSTGVGAAKINLNTAPLVVLRALFSNVQDRDYAQGIVDRRRGSSAETTETPSAGMNPTTADPQEGGGNPFTDVNQLSDGSVPNLTAEVLQRNGIDVGVEFDTKSDVFSVRIQGSTTRTQRDELYVVERAKTENGQWGFRFLLHQERTDRLLEVEDDAPAVTPQ
ncbi:MAG TPA: type II secretion system protein GspK [Planctomycetota bacterium]|nr:type II secretion system protein GspK [Planctomycetota bacterium]